MSEDNPPQNNDTDHITSVIDTIGGESIRLIKNITKSVAPNFNVSSKAWYLFSALVFLVVGYITQVPLAWLIISLFVLLVAELLSSNVPWFMRTFSPQKQKEEFLKNVEKRDVLSVSEYISGNNALSEKELLQILSHKKFLEHPAILKSIALYQKYTDTLIDYLEEKKIFGRINNDVDNVLILFYSGELSKPLFEKLKNQLSGEPKGTLIIKNCSFCTKPVTEKKRYFLRNQFLRSSRWYIDNIHKNKLVFFVIGFSILYIVISFMLLGKSITPAEMSSLIILMFFGAFPLTLLVGKASKYFTKILTVTASRFE